MISMAILRHVEATADERAAYLKMARAVLGEEVDENGNGGERGRSGRREPCWRRNAMPRWVPPSSSSSPSPSNGYGKRTSTYEFRITGRGGKGIVAMTVNDRNGPLVASFPVEDEDQIMLVTDGGQLIRCPVHDIRKAGRSTQGVTVLKTAGDEQVVSVERISEEAEEAQV